ncbi:hypothetical protein [Streptomyces sioyaensis]|uniref:hypothetical protein n=1 Tax=Streptomyces sioyaensis TaxID=67364 RepID=UPI0035AB864E
MVRAGRSSERAQLIYQHSKRTHQRKIDATMDADVRRQRQEASEHGEQVGELATVHGLGVRTSRLIGDLGRADEKSARPLPYPCLVRL